MNRLHLIIILTLALCISCQGKRTASSAHEGVQDSIVATGVKNPFGFLEKLGIDYELLIANGDTLPTPFDSSDCLLTTKEQGALLKGVISSDFDISKDTLVYLVAVRQINDNVILCQYNHRRYFEDVYIATYNTDGVLIDVLFAGELGNKSFGDRILSDSIELRIVRHNQIHFIGNHEFTLTREYKELEYDTKSDRDTITYNKTISLTYNIESDGKIKMTLPDAEVCEDGVFRLWDREDGKKEWDLMDEIYTLNLYSFSDEKALERWNIIGKKADGAPAESVEYYFFIYVFKPQPQRVLKWLYDNRDDESITLPMHLEFEYTQDPQSREIIDNAIAQIDDKAMRAYFKALTAEWSKEIEH
ncbi:MAG: hypothetical protein K2N28_01210 [Muribaculaceae bacterium]|nr:hypothetical protein [Muribaculaceae bacterium]